MRIPGTVFQPWSGWGWGAFHAKLGSAMCRGSGCPAVIMLGQAWTDDCSPATLMRPVGIGIEVFPTTVKLQTAPGELTPLMGQAMVTLWLGKNTVGCSVGFANLEDCDQRGNVQLWEQKSCWLFKVLDIAKWGINQRVHECRDSVHPRGKGLACAHKKQRSSGQCLKAFVCLTACCREVGWKTCAENFTSRIFGWLRVILWLSSWP